MSSGQRRFSDKEVERILKDAARMQSASSLEGGLSEDEIARIGDEMGVDRRHVQAAIDSMEDADGHQQQTRWIGAPPSYELERVVPGQLGESNWQAIVHELNATFSQSVESEQKGSIRSWHWKHDLGNLRLDAIQGADSVRFRLVSYIDDGLSGGCVLAVIGMLIGTGAMFSIDLLRPWLSILLSVLLVLAITAYARYAASNWYRRDRRKLTKLLDEVVRISQDESCASVPATSGEPVQKRLEQGA